MGDNANIIVPALFMHIQKTAGTSIINMAARHYGNSNISSHGSFVGRSPEEFSKTPFVSGHFGYDFAKKLMPGRFSFTFLREPIERVISFYSFCRSRNPDDLPIYRIAHDLELEGFLHAAKESEIVRRGIWNSQVWRMASGPGLGTASFNEMSPDEMLTQAVANMSSFSFVGFTETFDNDVTYIGRALRFSSDIKPARVNITPFKVINGDLPLKTMKLIEELTYLDRKLYEIALRNRQTNGFSV